MAWNWETINYTMISPTSESDALLFIYNFLNSISTVFCAFSYTNVHVHVGCGISGPVILE